MDTNKNPPIVRSGPELYDEIMSHIEPDLVSANLPTLHEKYGTETEAEKVARAARYTAAFAEYDKKFQEYNDRWMAELRAYKQTAFASFENRSRETDASQLATIQSTLETL